ILRKADLQTRVRGKDLLAAAGEYTAQVIQGGLCSFLEAMRPPGVDLAPVRTAAEALSATVQQAETALPGALPPRPPTFCTGCPERPVFSAIKMLEEEVGKVHIAADIGCHAFATFEPFSMGN